MKLQFLVILCSVCILFAICDSTGDNLNLYNSVIFGGKNPNGVRKAPARRSLLSYSKELDTALVAALDGTIYLLELNSMKPLWSFASGPSIYSSYQAPIDNDNETENASGTESSYFIDCGDDWELYAHSRLGKLKLMKSLEEYISSTPQIAEDGGIVLGSKITSAFLVDAKSGKLLYKYKMSDTPTAAQMNDSDSFFYKTTFDKHGLSTKAGQMPLYITRTDYALTSFVPNSDKVLWNVTVAEIGAAFLCNDSENSFVGSLSDSGSSDTDVHFNMPLPCQSRALVYRFRNHNILDHLSNPNGLPEARHQDLMLPTSISNNILPSQPNVDKVLESLPSSSNSDKLQASDHNSGSEVMLPLPLVSEKSKISRVQEPNMLSERLGSLSLVFFTSLLVGIVTYRCGLLASNQPESGTPSSSISSFNRRKKSRKSVKNGSNSENNDKDTWFDGEAKHKQVKDQDMLWSNINQPTLHGVDGRTIGKLYVSEVEIAKGSNGTIVLEGIYEGRPVAVKRLVRAHHDIAFKEVQNLIASDRHPNIVRWYGVEQDQDFVYLSLERCICSLNDLIQMYSDSSQNPTLDKRFEGEVDGEYRVNMGSMMNVFKDSELWKQNGYPSPLLLKLMRDVVSGLVHLHELGIIHRDLKPQNVLIIKERYLCAKLSDMGISKRLTADMSSLGHNATGYGSSGWQAPEQLLHGRQTRAVDLFSLGCVLFFCVTGGKHPFGSRLERDINIAKNKVDLFLVEHIPEAVDLFSQLLYPVAKLRPKASEVFAHPLFWSAEMRLSFLRDTSDRVELEDRENGSALLKELESIEPVALGGKWDEKMESAFINNIGRYRRYRFHSVRDLLRVMRNKLNHYRELPREIQEILGSVPEGFDAYFTSRFPKLLIEVYKVMRNYCSEEECFAKYFRSNVQ